MAEVATPETTAAPAVSAEDVARLQAQTAEAHNKLKEFRENNTTYLKERDEARLAAKAAADELQKFKDAAAAAGAGIPNEKVEELLKQRYGRALEDKDAALQSLDQKLANEQKERTRLMEILRERSIDTEVSIVSGQLEGFIPGALEDARFQARGMFQLDENGVPVARDNSGKPVFGSDGKTPLTIEGWMAGLRSSKPHWFKAGVNGGGAAGGAGTGGATHVIKRSDAADVGRYRAAKAAADKAGVTLQILD